MIADRYHLCVLAKLAIMEILPKFEKNERIELLGKFGTQYRNAGF